MEFQERGGSQIGIWEPEENSGDIDGTNKIPVHTGVSANKHGDIGKKEMVPRARIELATRGFSVRNTSDVNAVNTSTCGGDSGEGTLKSTLDDAKTSQMDGIREALAGLSRDELLGMLAHALADGGEPSTTGDNGNG